MKLKFLGIAFFAAALVIAVWVGSDRARSDGEPAPPLVPASGKAVASFGVESARLDATRRLESVQSTARPDPALEAGETTRISF